MNPNERSHLYIDKEKFDEGHKKAFGERTKITCTECDLSSRQKQGVKFECPHCGHMNSNGDPN